MKKMLAFAGIFSVFLFHSHLAWAQQVDSSASANPTLLASSQPAAGAVPRLIRFSGVLKDHTGKLPSGVVGLTCSLYELQEGGSPLWVESETVKPNEQGRYTVLLGGSLPEGLPLDLFTTGKALWLGVQAQLPGEGEQARVPLVAVPYALKAVDADTLGGKSLGDFVLSSQLTSAVQTPLATTNTGTAQASGVTSTSSNTKSTTSSTSGTGIVSLNSLTASTQTIATGKSGTDFNIVSSSSTHTINIPDASTSARGLVTTAAQTFAGDKAFSNNLVVKGPSPHLNVKAFGAVGNGIADDTTAIQNAINAAASGSGSIVFFPPGVYLASQIALIQGISLVGSGMNPSPWGLGTTLKQKAGVNQNFIVSSSSDNYQHWSVISNMQLQGDPSNTSGSGIHFSVATGEGTKFEHLQVDGFAAEGIFVWGGVPLYMEDIHPSENGTYGVNINPTGTAPMQTHLLTMISGDDNGTALIHLGPSRGVGGNVTWLIEGVKAEKHTPGKQNDAIILDTMNGSPVTIHGVAFLNNSGQPANSAIKIINASARLTWSGIDATALPSAPSGGCSGSCVNYTVNDNSANGFNSIRASGTYGGDYFVNRLWANYGTGLTSSDFSLSGWGSSASVSVYPGSTDQRGQIAVTANGSGTAANPTVTLTFHDGTWFAAPFAIVARNDANAPAGTPTWSTTSRKLVITFQGTPVAGSYYTFTWMVIG
jgi:hypothetical protein